MTTASATSTARGWWLLLPLAPALALGLWLGGEFALWGLTAVGFPYELDYGEGPILAQLQAASRGERVYVPLDQAPYTVANYPPFFRWCARAVALVTGTYLSAGRLVSVLATFLAAAFVGGMVFTRAHRNTAAAAGPDQSLQARRERLDPTAALALALVLGAVAGLAVLAPTFVFLWGVLLRVDALALSLALAGLAVAVCFPRRVELSLPLLLAGLFTKQSALAAPAAVCLALILHDRRRGLRFTGALVGGGLILYGVGVALTDGAFHENLVTANRNRFEWARVAQYARALWSDHALLLTLGFVSAAEQLARVLRAPRAERDPARNIALFYYAAALVVSLAVGKLGSNVNYFLDLLAASALLSGLLLADLLGAWASRRATLAQKLAGVLAALVLAGFFQRADHLELLSTLKRELRLRQAEGRELVARLEAVVAPVLCEDLVLQTLAGHPAHYQPFELAQLAAQGLWDPRPLLDEVEAEVFSMVVLKFDLARDPEWRGERFPPALIEALRAHYVEAERIGRYVLYRPKG